MHLALDQDRRVPGGLRVLLAVGGLLYTAGAVVYATIDGVDYVSMGALTHSAPILDLSLLLEIPPS